MKTTQLTLGALQMLTLGGPMLASIQSQGVGLELKNNVNMEAINASTLNSIESTWLKIPVICKARGFNASPTPTTETISTQNLKIYSAFESKLG